MMGNSHRAGVASTARTDVGDGIHIRQLLTCGHRALVRKEFADKYPFEFCERCQQTRNFAKSRPKVPWNLRFI
jgi:hypothetical protein